VLLFDEGSSAALGFVGDLDRQAAAADDGSRRAGGDRGDCESRALRRGGCKMGEKAGTREFGAALIDTYSGAVLTYLIAVGHETGLFEAAARARGSSAELAERTQLNERYVREWLGAMTTGGVFTYDAETGTYELPVEHAARLTGHAAGNAAPMSRSLIHFATLLPRLIECFRHGGGISYDEFRPEFTDRMDDLWRRIYDEQLLDGFIAPVTGLTDRLDAGIAVADIGCGSGHAVNLLASAYPASRFVGYDIATDAIAIATAEAEAMGLSNSRFEVLDVNRLPHRPALDLITAFDAVHDQVDPATVLKNVRKRLADDGVFLMVDFKFSSKLEENLDNPFAPLYYGISTMHCLTVSLAEGGAGLGTIWGIQTARRMLAEAGFSKIEVLDSPRPQNCIYVCRP
jgi:SAM-dependent methyltransferase